VTPVRRVPFSRPHLVGTEVDFVTRALQPTAIAADGAFTAACSRLLEERFGLRAALLVTSCTAALEMAVVLAGAGPGDEVVLPSFTFVSTANAVVRAGATPVFADVCPDTLNIDPESVRAVLTDRTKAVIAVHYAGVGADMDALAALTDEHGLLLIEDAAQGVNAFWRDRALGSIGQLGCYSFHHTKNFICGEGGALCVNDEALVERAEVLRDKGTNRRSFLRGEVDKYTWVDVGSSYVPSELQAAMLLAQLEHMDRLTEERATIAAAYRERLTPLEQAGLLQQLRLPAEARSNHHLCPVLANSPAARDRLMAALADDGIGATFHYVPLHQSPMGRRLGLDRHPLPHTDDCAARLLRLPLYNGLTLDDVDYVVERLSVHLRAASAAA
jgi:dTDP-4-amino-4,6-dideoxygalactose transaminase